MMPLYLWIVSFVGFFQGELLQRWKDSLTGLIVASIMLVLCVIALMQLVGLPLFRTTASHGIFRLAVVDAKGRPANRVTLLRRWAIVWFPLLVPMSLMAVLAERIGRTAALICALVLLVLWTGAAVHAVIVPNRGLHDRLAGTWVVRR